MPKFAAVNGTWVGEVPDCLVNRRPSGSKTDNSVLLELSATRVNGH